MRRFAQFELAARYYALEFHQGHVNERRLAPTTLDRKRPEVDKTKKLPEDTMPGDSTKTGDMENGLDKPRHTQATLLIGEGAEAGPVREASVSRPLGVSLASGCRRTGGLSSPGIQTTHSLAGAFLFLTTRVQTTCWH